MNIADVGKEFNAEELRNRTSDRRILISSREMKSIVWLVVGWTMATASLHGQEPGRRAWPDANRIEEFLARAEIVSRTRMTEGVTNSERVTLALDGETHEAVLKKIDQPDDSWRHEVAAYELDKLLGLGMVPPTVRRKDKGRAGGLQLWVEGKTLDALPEDLPDLAGWRQQVSAMWLFDYLTANNDRHANNVLASPEGRLLMIDNSRSFPLSGSPLRTMDEQGGATRALFWRTEFDPELAVYPTTYSAALVARLRSLTDEILKISLGSYLDKAERRRLLARRDTVLQAIGE